MTYNFDKEIERIGTGSLKWDGLEKFYGSHDLQALWVADMDFETPPFIMDALKQRLQHPVLGYSLEPEGYWNVISQWIKDHHNWTVQPEWMTYIPGIVKGIGMVINLFVKEDEKVIVQPPVYHPFRLTALGNGREVVYNPLLRKENGLYEMDFDQLEQIVDEKCRLLILANPHNPAGIIWEKETLEKLADFCHRNHILVISDEIHCDMALWGKKHIPFASVSEKAAACSITFGAPTKTFNIAGVVSSYAIVVNEDLRKKFFGWLTTNEWNHPTLFATTATMAAFSDGEEWRQQMLHYVEENILFVENFCKQRLPQIKPLRPDASFLVWLDCTALQIPQKHLIDLFVKKAHIALNDGAMFGSEGEGFMRMNVGCPRSFLEKAMELLAGCFTDPSVTINK